MRRQKMTRKELFDRVTTLLRAMDGACKSRLTCNCARCEDARGAIPAYLIQQRAAEIMADVKPRG